MNQDTFTQELLDKLQSGQNLPEAMGLDEKAMEAIEQIAVACYQEGRLESARRIFEGLVSLLPDRQEYWSALGGVLTRLEEHEKAIPVLTVALELDDTDTSALVNRGECLLALGQVESASKDLERAIELDPDENDPASNRARQLVYGFDTFFTGVMEEGLSDVEFEDEDEPW